MGLKSSSSCVHKSCEADPQREWSDKSKKKAKYTMSCTNKDLRQRISLKTRYQNLKQFCRGNSHELCVQESRECFLLFLDQDSCCTISISAPISLITRTRRLQKFKERVSWSFGVGTNFLELYDSQWSRILLNTHSRCVRQQLKWMKILSPTIV